MSNIQLEWLKKEINDLKTKLLNNSLSLTERVQLTEQLIEFYKTAERTMKADS